MKEGRGPGQLSGAVRLQEQWDQMVQETMEANLVVGPESTAYTIVALREEVKYWKRKYRKKLGKHHSFVQKFRALKAKMRALK